MTEAQHREAILICLALRGGGGTVGEVEADIDAFGLRTMTPQQFGDWKTARRPEVDRFYEIARRKGRLP